MKVNKKHHKKKKLSKKQKILLMILIAILVIEIILIAHKVYVKYILADEDIKVVETKPKEQLESDNYNYYLSNNASKYEEELFKELKNTLSKETIIEEDYATILSKLFISDLFTLSTKKNSSDITSSQYIYTDYQEMYKTIVKDTIYSNIEINLDGKRTQALPTVTNVEVLSIERESFSKENEVLDSDAYHITVSITYEKDMEYPTTYELIMIKNNQLLQIVKTGEEI